MDDTSRNIQQTTTVSSISQCCNDRLNLHKTLGSPHFRIYTRKTLLELLTDSGLVYTQLHVTPTPFELVFPQLINSKVGNRFLTLNAGALKIFPRLIGYQFIAVCKPAKYLTLQSN